ncbi:restriction endonuclease subunit S [Streptococcus chenjunshii]|uniref:Restriction endonuclease subunit S n=1 Tax=Streptococcus chenjunshii TaxID=2173853 RepID=A0A372KLE6_9STRE|nr:restriction endonuclease subunit S [Streptococcus chenjunshii]AXQ79624.1 restriction endonuclease subunit S [Streptococcus chenjunshii]RFU51061.1 restriction endonuclease subunit S [Streptococcus chenjunshii]RFU53105.1 restriction endonuclease subunit S [Streptococcus chenjunshii]
MTNQNIPKIRFKGFDNNWETGIELNDTIEKQFKGKARQEQLNEGVVMYLDANTLNGNTPFLSNAEADTDSKDILIMWDGSNAGKVFTGFEGALGSTLKGYKVKDENDSYFIFNYLVKYQKKIYEQYRTPNIPHVIKNFTEVFKVSLPSLPEQSAIGTLFQTLDELLSAYKDNLANYQAFKATMLTKMFPKAGQTTPEIRLDGFDGEWEEKKLGELAEIVRGASPRPIQDPKWFDGSSEVGWLRISDVTNQNGRIYDLEQRISELGQEKTRVLKEPHLLLSIAASVGKPVINYVQTGVHDGFLIFLNPIFDKEFMFQWLEMFKDGWNKYGQSGSQVNLNSDIVKNHKLKVPTLNEQHAIGAFFANLDDLISSYQAKITELETLKKKLLQDMFV